MPFFKTSDNVAIHYEDTGQGCPVIFVHGWGLSGGIWSCQSGLASICRMIVPDLRGHGRSSAPDNGYSFSRFAADLAELADFLSLDKVLLVGWSMGVQIALQTLPLMRSRLSAMILISGTPKFTSEGGYRYGLPASEIRGLQLLLKRDLKKGQRGFIDNMLAPGENSDGIEEPPLSLQGAIKSLQTLENSDLRDMLSLVDLPVLLIHGSKDRICLHDSSRYMVESLSNGRLVTIEGAGHIPFLTRAEEFNAVFCSFMDEIYAFH